MRRPSKSPPRNPTQLAPLATEEPDRKPAPPRRSLVSAYLALIGRKGGLKGGKARAAKLTAKRRRQIAVKAAQSRWASSRKSIP